VRVKNITPTSHKHQHSRKPRECEPQQEKAAANEYDTRQEQIRLCVSHHKNYPLSVNE
jgi:hypothetical protein